MKTQPENNFDDIRPLHDNEVPAAIKSLLANDYFRRAVEPLLKPLTWEMFSGAMLACKSVHDFQRTIIYPFMKQLIAKTTSELNGIVQEIDRLFSQRFDALVESLELGRPPKGGTGGGGHHSPGGRNKPRHLH